MSTRCQLIRFDIVDQTLKPRFVDGEELPNWRQGPDILEYIRQMALQWWLVTVRVQAEDAACS